MTKTYRTAKLHHRANSGLQPMMTLWQSAEW